MSQSQFHHFIPQFILKNFSHKYHPPSLNSKSSTGRKKKHKKNKIYPGEPVLHIIDLKGTTPLLCEASVKRTFGLMDMYQDVSNASDHNILEKELSKLESRVSQIIAGIKKAFESSKDGFSMSRDQRDMLRKFLFIMKYRGPGFHRRFHGDKSGRYVQNDAAIFEKYMAENGYHNPVDVWYKSIKTILDLRIDVQGKWRQELLAEIYPDDAFWFIMHMELYYLAFCTPDGSNEEFLLTENCYNVHEGPNSTILNPETGKPEVTSWSSYHEFAPITPRLILILRSSLLPNAEEDTNELVKEPRRNLFELSRSFHVNPDAAISILEDLPLKKPRNSYSQVLAQGIELLPGEDGSRRSNHRFTFPFFRITTDQVHRVNDILLENAHLTSVIGYNSKQSLKESLEHYLELPTGSGFKAIYRPHDDARLVYLQKIEMIARSLGSTVVMSYEEIPGEEEMEASRQESLRQLQKAMLDNIPEQPSEFMQLYQKLGGDYHTLLADLEQVKKMRFLRIKIDVVTQGFREVRRERVREHLRDLFCQSIPSRRLWLYLKGLREMSLGSPDTPYEESAYAETFDGPEDVIVKAKNVVRPECLNLLLHFTVMQDIQHRLMPGLSPSSEITFDKAGIKRLQKITHLTFASVGSIRDCGIRPIQDHAIATSNIMRLTKVYEQHMIPVWTIDENIEVLTRAFVREDMMTILSGNLGEDLVAELSDVLFNIVYPAYEKPVAR
ncbi:hypothetical protein FB567DRAFT_515306 [Paraphoma chrysanthemicola]|uniref:DUF4238 domain-containing protein n=1 Tax=Paraphoma chrysanthemicola TaxID=798071 RepID=A0A8K0RF20_9PLEO|nr:hypothetical protein FB567DRAFT_515306 [Paraphoma chrysanthemicola]